MMADQREAKRAFDFFKTVPGTSIVTSTTSDGLSVLYKIVYNGEELATMIVTDFNDGYGPQADYLYEKT